MMYERCTDKIKRFFKCVVRTLAGFLFGIFLIPLGMIYMVICLVWGLADYLVKKTERS